MAETRSETSPDGRVQIQYEAHEMRMSHWIDVPHITHAETGRALFISRSDQWSGHHAWGVGGQFTLTIALYPDASNSVTLHFDIGADRVSLGPDGAPHPVADAAQMVENALAQRA